MAKAARNKPYRPKPTYMPLMQVTRNDIALGLHLAVEALIHAPSKLTYDQLNRMVAALAIAGGKQDAARHVALVAMAQATSAIAARHELLNFIILTDEEMAVLRAGAGQVDDFLAGMCALKLKDATERVSIAYRSMNSGGE